MHSKYPSYEYEYVTRWVDLESQPVHQLSDYLVKEAFDLEGAKLEYLYPGYQDERSLYLVGYRKWPKEVADKKKLEWDEQNKKAKEFARQVELLKLAELKAKYPNN